MNQNHIDASEFERGLLAGEMAALTDGAQGTGRGCDCGGAREQSAAESRGCEAEQRCPRARTVCCYQVTPRPRPLPPVDEECCCKQSFRAALQALCDAEIAEALDFDKAAFLTDTFVAGASLEEAEKCREAPDNLSECLDGTFKRFSPCSCDLLDVDAELYYPQPGKGEALGVTADQVSVCALSAVVIQAADTDCEEETARQFRCLKRALSARLNPCGGCGDRNNSGCCCPADSDDCCCVDGVLSALSGSNLSRRVTLTAGWLALNNVELLGAVGNVMVLAADDTRRVYFVCASKVGYLG